MYNRAGSGKASREIRRTKDMEKMYWFSTKKHAHDINLRSDRLSNEIAELERDGKEVPKAMTELKERLDEIIGYMSGACDQPVQLPGRLYGLAMDTVGWAAAFRGSAQPSRPAKQIGRTTVESVLSNLDSLLVKKENLLLAYINGETEEVVNLQQIHAEIDEISELISAVQSGHIKRSEWERACALAEERACMRYENCLQNGMSATKAAAAFKI